MRPTRLPLLVAACSLLLSLGSPAGAQAGGHGDRALLLVDPSDPEALYVANEYVAARGIPASQVLYMRPGATDYQAFAAANVPGFLGELENRAVRDRVDLVVVAPTADFYVPTPGLVTDNCFPVNRIAIGGAYGLALVADDILDGIFATSRNHYYDTSDDGEAFDSGTTWYFGVPSTDTRAQQYFVGGLLGYTGSNGNTLQEVLDLIGRSVAVDGTHPLGTVYFMQTTDAARSGPRHGTYAGEVADILADGGQAQHLFADLPLGSHDCTGIMTGRATLDIDGADLTLLPGSFADHLTSFAGTFDNSSQTKMSRWIAKGASGTAGTVEEPCNYAGKFPHAGTHQLIFRGLTLGEAWARRLLYKPFQDLFYGDPLTAPYAWFPTVDVPGFPAGPVAGTITLTPTAAATQPGAAIEALELTVDGVRRAAAGSGGDLVLDTTRLADGWHEVRVLAFDDAPERNPGRFVGLLEVDNHGRSVALSTAATAGDLATPYALTVSAAGGVVDEVRVLHNGRVVASAPGGAGTVTVFGQNLGAGPARLVAEATFVDGVVARSLPLDLTTAYAGAPAGTPPVAYGYARRVYDDVATVLELPAAFDADPSTATYTVTLPPAQATLLSSDGGPFVVLAPGAGAAGLDSLQFTVTTPDGTSAVATLALEYAPRPGASVYGCGVNPAGSIAFAGGRAVPGDRFQVALDNPLATQAPGTATFLFFAFAPDPAFPCGTSLPNFGMAGGGAPGELLVSLLPPDPVAAQVGPVWQGTPVVLDVAVPDDLSLVDVSVFAQGLLLDPTAGGGTGAKFGLTDGLQVDVGAY